MQYWSQELSCTTKKKIHRIPQLGVRGSSWKINKKSSFKAQGGQPTLSSGSERGSRVQRKSHHIPSWGAHPGSCLHQAGVSAHCLYSIHEGDGHLLSSLALSLLDGPHSVEEQYWLLLFLPFLLFKETTCAAYPEWWPC